jgi:hypothetical protein
VVSEYLSAYKEKSSPVHTHDAVATELSGIVRCAAGDVRPGDSISTLIVRAARALGLECGRAKRLWYRELRVIPAHEADNLRAWHRQHLARRVDRLNAELVQLQAQLAMLEDGEAA